VAKLHGEAARTLNDGKVKESLVRSGMEVVGNTPEAFAEFLKRESETTGRLIQAGGIKVE